METQQKQMEEELDIDNEQLDKMKQKLESFSKTTDKNKKLSESVDLDQSKLEGKLNAEVEAKQRVISAIHKRKISMNDSCTSMFLNENESEKSLN